MRRNRAAVVTEYVDTVQERIVHIASHVNKREGTLNSPLREELDIMLKAYRGLKALLDQAGGKKRDALLLTKNGRVRILGNILTQLGNNIQQQRVIEGVAVDRLADADAAYSYLHKALSDLKAKQAIANKKTEEYSLRGIVRSPR